MLAVGVSGVLAAAVWLMWTAPWPGAGEEAAVEQPAPSGVGDEDAGGEVLSSERARELERGVNARDPERLQEVVLVGDDHDPVEVAEQALPVGSQLVIDEGSFAQVEQGSGVVEATIVGEQAFAVRLLLVEVDGRWMLAGSSEPEAVS